MSAERVENLRRLGAHWSETTDSGLVLLVARRGVIVLHEAWGSHGRDTGFPLSVDAIFPLASLGKIFVATCVMQLVEDGLLGLNRPVQEYLPEFQGKDKEKVLVHHLLTHTSGLREEDIAPRMRPLMQEMVSDLVRRPFSASTSEATEYPLSKRFLKELCLADLSHEPGLKMSYSLMAGYTLLTEIVQRLSSLSLEDFARQRIFEPLGMHDTSFLISEAEKSRVVDPSAGPSYSTIKAIVGRVIVGPGSATSTARDMATFGQAFLDRGRHGSVRILSRAGIAEMTRNQIPGIPAEYLWYQVNEASWGYGWGVTGTEKWERTPSLLSPETFWHTGGSGTGLYVDPINELVFVYFSSHREGTRRTDDLFANAAVAAIDD